jgi:HrpA-like RNA helicase
VASKIRFEDTTTRKTILKVMTDGVLVAELIGDNLLSKYGVVIIDEVHCRNMNTDLLLAFLKFKACSVLQAVLIFRYSQGVPICG